MIHITSSAQLNYAEGDQCLAVAASMTASQGCHHVPFLLWSHRSAQAQGFTVDSQKLAEWDEWTRKDSLANRLLFRLRNYDLGRPEAATLPLAVKDKLKPLIARPFQTEAEFLAELTPLLTEDEMKSHRATVLKISERTIDIFDRVGGGL